MRRVEMVMGMPASIDIPAAHNKSDFSIVFDRLRKIDNQFSTYKSDSEVSRYIRGDLADSQLSSLMLKIKRYCSNYEIITNGYFSAYYSGKYDPTGYVKGWAIQQAADILLAKGFTTFLINIAGDILAASDNGKKWHVGLQHPTQKSQTIGTVSVSNGAIATSGTYENVEHITNPHTGVVAYEIISATVRGGDIITTDVFATACVAMGVEKALSFIESQDGYEALFIDRVGNLYMTSQFVPTKN